MAAHLFIGVLVALLIGAPLTWFWTRPGRARLEATEGRRTLAAMRWREFSQFVISALQAQGFEANPLEHTQNARHHADLLLTRGERSWLLSCRQAADYRVTGKQVEEMATAVRTRSAAGGIIATLGSVDPAARQASPEVELIDGGALWRLICPLLPAGLLEHIEEQTRSHVRRNLAVGWLLAALIGAAIALLFGRLAPEPVQAEIATPVAAPAPATTPVAAPAGAPANATATAPRNAPTAAAPTITGEPPAEGSPEDLRQRQAIVDALTALPGVDHAIWSTRSTLLVYAAAGVGDQHDPVCGVVERFDALRASRIQLQGADGTTASVRFFHCSTY